jgi:NTP pyrophosphatase (non-canonical NTP hydrolase)
MASKMITFAADEKFLAIMQEALITRFVDFDEWTETDLGCALAGEVGELCNMLKKRKRKKHKGDNISKKECGKEMADVLAYLLVLAEKMDIDITEAYVDKFNEVSRRKKSNIRMKVV